MLLRVIVFAAGLLVAALIYQRVKEFTIWLYLFLIAAIVFNPIAPPVARNDVGSFLLSLRRCSRALAGDDVGADAFEPGQHRKGRRIQDDRFRAGLARPAPDRKGPPRLAGFRVRAARSVPECPGSGNRS